jgi:hypothetical protein
MKKLFLLALAALLFACFDSYDPPEDTDDTTILLKAKRKYVRDSVIYLADTVKFVDELIQSASYSNDDDPWLHYSIRSMTSGVDIGLWVTSNSNGGNIKVWCSPNQYKEITFEEPVFPATAGVYKLIFKDSLEVNDSTYYNILKFDATDTLDKQCNISAFYYGMHDGIVKVVSKNGVELNRVPASVYEDALERRAEERARADSIAQAVADSIARAVADSIIQANTNKENGSDQENEDGDSITVSQDVADLAESVADCIRDAYLSGSLSALSDCEL